MKKLPPVEEARAIMKKGMEWGVWKWLLEKKHVRQIADAATDALNGAEMKVKAAWGDDLKVAYDILLEQDSSPKRKRTNTKGATPSVAPEIMLVVKAVKEADDEAEDKRLDAEETFEEAERRMSTAGAREGARKALETYDLHERAIRLAESAAKCSKGALQHS
jgi:hypothetical protein